jgi:hypothetical protein
MLRHLCVAIVAASCVSPCVHAQVSSTTSESTKKASNPTLAQADYSKEALVEEQDATKIDFENDGSFRVRTQL